MTIRRTLRCNRTRSQHSRHRRRISHGNFGGARSVKKKTAAEAAAKKKKEAAAKKKKEAAAKKKKTSRAITCAICACPCAWSASGRAPVASKTDDDPHPCTVLLRSGDCNAPVDDVDVDVEKQIRGVVDAVKNHALSITDQMLLAQPTVKTYVDSWPPELCSVAERKLYAKWRICDKMHQKQFDCYDPAVSNDSLLKRIVADDDFITAFADALLYFFQVSFASILAGYIYALHSDNRQPATIDSLGHDWYNRLEAKKSKACLSAKKKNLADDGRIFAQARTANNRYVADLDKLWSTSYSDVVTKFMGSNPRQWYTARESGLSGYQAFIAETVCRGGAE